MLTKDRLRLIGRRLVQVAPVIVLATQGVGGAILAESSLTFLGLGISPLVPTWGAMIADGRNYLTTAWWISIFPGVAIVATGLGFSLAGDGVADLLRPRR